MEILVDRLIAKMIIVEVQFPRMIITIECHILAVRRVVEHYTNLSKINKIYIKRFS